MPNIQVKLRRGTTSQHSSFAGAQGEVTVDTDLNTLMVHTGGAAGSGVRLAKHSELSAGGGGTVTSVGSGTGLTGGPITTSGTLALANTAVSPGSYTNTNLTVDAQGRITAASNGSGGAAGTPNYSTGWFNDATGLLDGGTYTFTHNLGTTNLTATIWVADDASGTNAQEVRNYFHANAGAEYGAVLTSISTTSTTLQLLQDGWIAINSSGVGPGLSAAGGESWAGHYVKVVLSASATVGAVSKYSTNWQSTIGGTALSNGNTLTINHQLGTDDVIVTVYASDATQTAIYRVDGFTTGTSDYGADVVDVDSNNVYLQLAQNGIAWMDSNGNYSGNTNNWGSGNAARIKVVVVG